MFLRLVFDKIKKSTIAMSIHCAAIETQGNGANTPKSLTEQYQFEFV